MRSERHNIPEQELSIKKREQELFVEPEEEQPPAAPAKPFAAYLQSTPAAPLSKPVKVLLWVVGVVVLALLFVSIWRVHRPSKAKLRARAAQSAAASVDLPSPDPHPE
jgi:hypothetical protein